MWSDEVEYAYLTNALYMAMRLRCITIRCMLKEKAGDTNMYHPLFLFKIHKIRNRK